MSNTLTTIDDKTIMELEQAVESCSLAHLQTMSPIKRTLTLAKGMQVIRKALVGEVMNDIKALANTPLGFLTDRPPGTKGKDGKPLTYHDDTIRDAIMEGVLRGASVIGNEMNVIAGRCYLTKQYFERQLRTWPGLTDLRIIEGVPTTSTSGGGALVSMRASWKLNGVPDEIICEHTSDGDFRIPVRVNSQMGVDAILGKAKRKLLAKIFARITDSQWASEQADADTVLDVEAVTETQPATDEQPHVLDNVQEALEQCETITEVREFHDQTVQQLTTDEDQARLAEWCEWRQEQIRASRGPRSAATE